MRLQISLIQDWLFDFFLMQYKKNRHHNACDLERTFSMVEFLWVEIWENPDVFFRLKRMFSMVRDWAGKPYICPPKRISVAGSSHLSWAIQSINYPVLEKEVFIVKILNQLSRIKSRPTPN